ncbi:Ger(x)C family spore germination protein [Clostridium algidicarnis]|uniref:Ger(X)C family germination protein n=1 Tax=Clostridium algidicarnis DSM 15099 TaxID=1121295 RepID=A0A2S6FZB0_9CLOT|nr:Ger(x)C family spore germination protein [Clostridium algidicarnis]MBB6631016.1 Ger(x)C family spore germination protein [Clostridium algidicarnis]MBB6698193.1 Ger(x)C family spore germination protein [Clostridium algidicarnis]MBU3194234.1 Ger(x)C family spore germination protein [Clostridium algidicarnis]MBU3197165.1 Ger(x)C family spore germination protein [Clostridium algidicarnis]MCB2286858.1 Ger(x)C family spore germination protein [Clostridium algidicarnis]
MRKIGIVAIIIICLCTTGCWDQVEIDRRILVSLIGIDAGKDISREKEDEVVNESSMLDLEKLKVSYSFPNIADFSPSKPTIQGDIYFTANTYSMEGALKEVCDFSSRSIYLEHVRVILISKDILAYPHTMVEILDYFERQPKINRRAYVIVTEGDPEEFIKVVPPIDKHTQINITGIMENNARNGFMKLVTLSELLISLEKNNSGIIPFMKIDKEKKEFLLDGSTVIKDYAFKGNLDINETLSLSILNGKLKSGVKSVIQEGHPIDFEIYGSKRRTKAYIKDQELNVDINISLEGVIKSAYLGKEDFNKDSLKELEDKISRCMEYDCKKVLDYLQKELNVDAIGVNEYIEKFQPKIWKDIKDDPEEAFSKAKINIKIDTSIRRAGITK